MTSPSSCTNKLRRQLQLYWVMDGSDLENEAGRDRVLDAIQGGVTCIQLRDKHSATRQLVVRAQTLVQLAQPWGVPVIINDRVDVARASGAAGVHLGQSDLPLQQACAWLPPGSIVGLSIEQPDQLHAEDAQHADYLAISPLFDTPSKTDTAPAWGMAALQQARQACAQPLVAIGGIDAGNVAEVWRTGVDGVAVVRAISAAAQPGQAAALLRQHMAQARPWQVPRVLSIAGSDSGGGAGIQADLKTCAALGCHGMSAITALTAQNSVGVQGIYGVEPAFIAQQIDSVLSDIGADAIKIGMLHTPEVVDVVAQALAQHPNIPVVLDPVMVATSGDALLTPDTVQHLVQKLFPLATLITPNLDELALLHGAPLADVTSALQAAQQLVQQGVQAVLVKGGHLHGDHVTDTLFDASGIRWQHSAVRIHSRNLHGSGCTLSSAIAAYLARGLPLVQAVEAAHRYVRQALLAGQDLHLGAGHGPLWHMHGQLKT